MRVFSLIQSFPLNRCNYVETEGNGCYVVVGAPADQLREVQGHLQRGHEP